MEYSNKYSTIFQQILWLSTCWRGPNQSHDLSGPALLTQDAPTAAGSNLKVWGSDDWSLLFCNSWSVRLAVLCLSCSLSAILCLPLIQYWVSVWPKLWRWKAQQAGWRIPFTLFRRRKQCLALCASRSRFGEQEQWRIILLTERISDFASGNWEGLISEFRSISLIWGHLIDWPGTSAIILDQYNWRLAHISVPDWNPHYCSPKSLLTLAESMPTDRWHAQTTWQTYTWWSIWKCTDVNAWNLVPKSVA